MYLIINHLFVAFVELDPSFIAGNSGTSAAATAASSSSAATPAGKPRKVPLNSTDKLHLLLRDLNFAVVSGHLNQMAKRLYDDYEVRWIARRLSLSLISFHFSSFLC